MNNFLGWVQRFRCWINELIRGLLFICSGGNPSLFEDPNRTAHDWDVACAQMCLRLPCPPCLKQLAMVAYFATLWSVDLAIGLVTGVFVLPIILVALSPLVAIVAAVAAPFVASFSIAMTAVPMALTLCRDPTQKAAFATARTTEYLCFGVVLAVLGRTACGEAVLWETQAFFSVLGLNLLALLIFAALHYCLKPLVRLETAFLRRLSCLMCAGKKPDADKGRPKDTAGCSLCPCLGCYKGQHAVLETE